ncbi:MAG: DUF6502 family protein [Desulfurivibrionaceae bacterium]
MTDKANGVLLAALIKILRPLIRILLRNGVPCGVMEELTRWLYVDTAAREGEIPGRKLSNSRLAILTGLSRKEVQRLKDTAVVQTPESSARYHRAARVISGWHRDQSFADNNGLPLPLAFDSAKPSFAELVKKYSGDIPARAILDELLHAGAVHRQEDGTIIPLARAYIPKTLISEKLDILGTDVADLITTIDKNLRKDSPAPLFQRKVFYDNVPAEVLPDFRRISASQGQELLEKLDGWLAAHDRDLNPHQQGTGRKRVGMGIYYFEEDFHENDQKRPQDS